MSVSVCVGGWVGECVCEIEIDRETILLRYFAENVCSSFGYDLFNELSCIHLNAKGSPVTYPAHCFNAGNWFHDGYVLGRTVLLSKCHFFI